MASRLQLNLVSDLSQAALEAKLILDPSLKSQQLQVLRTQLKAAAGGEDAMTVELSSGAVTASGTVTCASVQAADTVTVNGNVFTAGTDWALGSSNTECAANLCAALNAASSLQWVVDCTSSGAVVTLNAACVGPLGNGCTLATSNNTRLAKSGTALTGGTNGSMKRLAFNR